MSTRWQGIAVCTVALLAGCHDTQRGSPPIPHGRSTSPVASADRTPHILRLDPQLDAVLAPDTRIERVATGFNFAEGPMWHLGRLWFSDLAGNRMYAVAANGAVALLLDHSGGLDQPPPGSFTGSNAMVTQKDGTVLMLQHGARRIVKLDDNDPAIIPFLDRFEGKRFNSPNDLVFAPDGSLWFTDPPFGLAGKDANPAKQLPFNGVFRYANGHLTASIRDLPTPNGIAFSPDGRTLYVSNSGPHMFVAKYTVAADGTLSRSSKLIEYPDDPKADVPDGMKVDSAGNIWTSGPGGIRIITPAGVVLGQIELPETAANLAWADGGRTLYITASTSIYRMAVKTPGIMPLYSR